MKTTFLRALLIAAALGVAAPVEAHPRAVALSPAASASVAPPTEIRLTFNEPLIARFSSITLTDHNSRVVRTGRARLSGDRKQIAVSLPRLSPGMYHVAWRMVSSDTHRVTGNYRFTVSR